MSEDTRGLQHVAVICRHLEKADRIFAPQVVVSVTPQAAVACRWRRKRSESVWVAMSHGEPWPGAGEASFVKRKAWQWCVADSLGHSDHLVVVSKAVARFCKRAGVSADPEVIYTGVKLGAPKPLSDGGYVGFVGRLSYEKGPDIFLRMLQESGAKGVVFGDGPMRSALMREAQAHDIDVSFEGWTDREVAFNSVDVLALTSRREGLPMTLLEAGARGLCVVARDVGGVGEVLREDPVLERNCLVPAEIPSAGIAEKVLRHLGDDKLRAASGRRLRMMVAERFDFCHQTKAFARMLATVAELQLG